MRETAWFVKYPRRVDDLKKPHPLTAEQPFAVVGTVKLDWMDYENFAEDLTADRAFLETYFLTAGEGMPMRCVLVRCDTRSGQLLIVPEQGCRVKYAAII